MWKKALLLCVLAVFASAWTEEGNVLVLTDADFPGIFTEFSHILIEFYAPWCGHCKKLAPIFAEVADELKAQEATVRVAKIDSTQNQKSAGEYGVRGYPTLYFFLNGEKIDYSGQRNKDSMVNWLLKKTRDPVVQIDAEKYAALASESGVSVIYHGDLNTAEGSEAFKQIAIADDYNSYYWGADLGKEPGTIEIIRNFDVPVTYSGVDDGLKVWVVKNQRPIVVPFDDRTISDIFGSSKHGVVLFNGQDSQILLDAFTEAAKQYSESNGKPLVFTEIVSSNEHLGNFANYIKIDHKSTPVILIDAGSQTKYVLKTGPTKESILEFLSNYQPHKHGLTDEVKITVEQVKTEEVEDQL